MAATDALNGAKVIYNPLPISQTLLPQAPAFQPPTETPPAFGHALRPFFHIKEGWRAMNNGSYGTCPRVVREAFVEWNDITEEFPDLFYRYTYTHYQNMARRRLAEEVLRCDKDNLVFTLNTTTGVNCILRSIFWEPEDVVLLFDTAYNACAATIDYLLDANPQLKMKRIELSYPLPHSEVLAKSEETIKEIIARGKKPRLFMFDAISSLPGVLVPWEKLVELCKKYQIFSLVDGAHTLGQIHLDLGRVKPDFYVSNCHKWFYSHRSSAVLYADPSVQHLVQSVPTNSTYIKKDSQGAAADINRGYSTTSPFVTSFEWPNTIDLSNHLSNLVALDLRQWLGGEAKIQGYVHKVAKEGGRLMADILGTSTMEVLDEAQDTDLVACMTNVRLPTPTGSKKDQWDQIIKIALLEQYQTFVPTYKHNGALWVRVSGQVFLELSDFEYLGHAIKDICDRLAAE